MNEHHLEILLVEDNPNDAELALDALRENKLANRIDIVRDGAEALDFVFCQGIYAVRDHPPSLILLDLKLPKVSGLEVLARIRSDPRTLTIPVIVLTASHAERDTFASNQLGINSYIVKPVDFEQFAAAVRQVGWYWLLLNQPPLV